MSEENRRQQAKELLIQPGSTSTSTWYKPPEAEAGEHYYKVMIVEGPKRKTFKPAKVNYSKEILRN